MRTFFKTTIIGIALAVPLATHPTDSAVAPGQNHRPTHHKAMTGETTVLAPSPGNVRSSTRIRVDGLSRNDDDCNMGCLDH